MAKRRKTRKNDGGIGLGTVVAAVAGVGAAGGLLFLATRDNTPATTTTTQPLVTPTIPQIAAPQVPALPPVTVPSLPQYGTGNGNLSMQAMFDADARRAAGYDPMEDERETLYRGGVIYGAPPVREMV